MRRWSFRPNNGINNYPLYGKFNQYLCEIDMVKMFVQAELPF